MHNTPNMPYGHNAQPEENGQRHKHHWQDFCRHHHYYMVQLETTDGHTYEGIIDGSDDENVYLLVPLGEMDREEENDRQFFPPQPSPPAPYFPIQPSPPPPFFPGFGIPRRFRRFRRFRFPFFGIRHLFFPYFY